MTPDQKLSACLIVKNEEANIARTLESLQGLVDEICLVDTGSTDRTVEIVREHGVEPFFFEWVDAFAAAKNCSKSKATGDWILMVDGDEVIDPIDHQRIRQAMVVKEPVCYRIDKRSYVNSPDIFKFEPNTGHYAIGREFAGWLTEANDLLFPNREDIYFEDCIHETVTKSVIAAGLRIEHLPGVVVHNFGRHDMSAKGELYGRLIRKRASMNPKDPIALFYLGLVESSKGDFEVAVDLFRESRELGHNEDALYHMASSYMSTHNSVEAEKAYIEYLRIRPDREEAWEELIRVFAFQKRVGKLSNTPSVLEKNGVDSPRVWKSLAGAYVHLGFPTIGQLYWNRAEECQRRK